MTMYPSLTIGPLQLSSFSIMVLLAFLVGALMGVQQARFLKVDPGIVWGLLPWAAVAGLAGAQLYSVAITLLRDASNISTALVNRGQVFYGGLIVGTLVTAWRFRRTGLPLAWLFDYGASCVAIAHAIGRIGCFLVGDDYGFPTSAPWAVAFPNGAPPSTAGYLRSMGADVAANISSSTVLSVHPVQLYEAIVLAALGVLLWRASRGAHRPFAVFAAYVLTYGAWRFVIEFWRPKNDHLVGILTSAQLISLGLVSLGAVILFRGRAAAENVAS